MVGLVYATEFFTYVTLQPFADIAENFWILCDCATVSLRSFCRAVDHFTS